MNYASRLALALLLGVTSARSAAASADPRLDAWERQLTEFVAQNYEANRGFVLLPRRWVVERSFAWARRRQRLAKDDERLPEVVAGLHFLAFVRLMLHRLVTVVAPSP